MATKKTAPKKMGRPAKKYIAVTFYLAFEPDTKLKDMMSEANLLANSDVGPAAVAKVTVKKSDGPYPKKSPKAPAKKVAAKKPAAKKPRKKG